MLKSSREMSYKENVAADYKNSKLKVDYRKSTHKSVLKKTDLSLTVLNSNCMHIGNRMGPTSDRSYTHQTNNGKSVTNLRRNTSKSCQTSKSREVLQENCVNIVCKIYSTKRSWKRRAVYNKVKKLKLSLPPLGTLASIAQLNKAFFPGRAEDLVLGGTSHKRLQAWELEDYNNKDTIRNCTLYVDQILESWRRMPDGTKIVLVKTTTTKSPEPAPVPGGGPTEPRVDNEEEELSWLPNRNYFKNFQTDINPYNRTMLFDWIIQVHQRFHINEKSLWATFMIFDMFLTTTEVEFERLQLIGFSCFWISGKANCLEDRRPKIDDLTWYAHDVFTNEELKECEEEILWNIEFNVNVPTAHNFLTLFIKAAIFSIKDEKKKDIVNCLAFYIAESLVLTSSSLDFTPEILAAGAVCTALRAAGFKWTKSLESYTGYSIKQLERVVHVANRTIVDKDGTCPKGVCTPPSGLLGKYSGTPAESFIPKPTSIKLP